MAVEVKTMDPLLHDLLKMEQEQRYCREAGTLLSGQNVKIGAVLAKRKVDPTAANTVVAAAGGGASGANTGNGTCTKDATAPVGPGAQAGAYRITFVEPTTNLGTFLVFRPDGTLLGPGVVGATFDSEIKFAIADGSTDFVVGDGFSVTVPAGDMKLVACTNVANFRGTHIADAIAMQDVDATGGDKPILYLARGPAIVVKERLVWDSSIDDDAKKAPRLAALQSLGIVFADAA